MRKKSFLGISQATGKSKVIQLFFAAWIFLAILSVGCACLTTQKCKETTVVLSKDKKIKKYLISVACTLPDNTTTTSVIVESDTPIKH